MRRRGLEAWEGAQLQDAVGSEVGPGRGPGGRGKRLRDVEGPGRGGVYTKACCRAARALESSGISGQRPLLSGLPVGPCSGVRAVL